MTTSLSSPANTGIMESAMDAATKGKKKPQPPRKKSKYGATVKGKHRKKTLPASQPPSTQTRTIPLPYSPSTDMLKDMSYYQLLWKVRDLLHHQETSQTVISHYKQEVGSLSTQVITLQDNVVDLKREHNIQVITLKDRVDKLKHEHESVLDDENKGCNNRIKAMT